MMLLATLLTSLTLAQKQTVSFDAPGLTLERAVKSLGERVDELLDVSPQIRDEVVIVHVTGVDKEQLLTQIAECVSARWRPTQRGRILERTAEQERAIKAASVEFRARELKKAFDELRPAVEREFNADIAKGIRDEILSLGGNSNIGVYSQLQSLSNQGPMGRLSYKLLFSIDPKLLVDLEYGERRVFSLTPTKMQFGLGKDAQAAFEQYVVEQNVWAATVTGVDAPGNTGVAGNPLLAKGVATEPPTDLLLVVRKGNSSSQLFCNVERVGRNGGPNEIEFQAIISDPRMGAAIRTTLPIPADATSEEKSVMEVVAGVYSRAGMPPIEKTPQILEPLKFDLPGFVANMYLSRVYRDQDLIATVADEAMFTIGVSGDDPLDRTELEKHLHEVARLDVSKEDEWVLIKPIDPYLATKSRSSRQALADLLAAVDRDGGVTFRAASDLNSRLDEPSMLGQVLAMFKGISPSALMQSPDPWRLTRFYGLLSSAQKTAFDTGKSIPYFSLSSAQKQAFNFLAVSQEIDNREWASDQSYRASGVSLEPTEALVNGVPSDAVATQRIEDGPIVFVYTKVNGKLEKARGPIPIQMVAYYEGARIKGTPLDGQPLPDAYAMGTKSTHIVRLSYPGSKWQEFTAIEIGPVGDAKPGAWTELPPDIVDQIKRAMGGLADY